MKKILILMLVLAFGVVPIRIDAKVVKNKSIAQLNSSLVGGRLMADGGGFYVIVIYDTSTSSIAAVGIEDISNNTYSVVSYTGHAGYNPTYGMAVVDFYVTFYHPGFGQNVTLRFDGQMSYIGVG